MYETKEDRLTKYCQMCFFLVRINLYNSVSIEFQYYNDLFAYFISLHAGFLEQLYTEMHARALPS